MILTVLIYLGVILWGILTIAFFIKIAFEMLIGALCLFGKLYDFGLRIFGKTSKNGFA